MKRILSMLLILTTLFTTLVVNVSAARVEEFVSDVALIYEDSVDDARKAIAGTDWKLFEQDLNANADYIIDDGVYLIYKTSTNVEDAITDLRVMDMYGGFSASNYERELENSRKEYLAMCQDIRTAATEFQALYKAGDGMAQLAYRQMNYYKDMRTKDGTETDLLMGDFFLNLPADDKIVQVFFEGNAMVVSNLVTLLAIGISGENEQDTLTTRVAEFYMNKDTLSDAEYYDDAVALSKKLATIRAKILRYDALSKEYNLKDEEMSEEEFSFMSDYMTIAVLLEEIKLGDTTFADILRGGKYEAKDLYPIVAALTKGQKALINIGQIETILKYNAPTKPISELNALLDEIENNLLGQNGTLPPYDVYVGVDRTIFKGTFAMTTAAARQQALTGKTWDLSDAASREGGAFVGYIVASSLDVAILGVSAGIHIAAKVMFAKAVTAIQLNAAEHFAYYWLSISVVGYPVSIAMAIIILATYGITTWVSYYNPDYLDIPNTMIDIRETSIGDKYIKYSAAKVFEDGKLSEKNADFNAYQGKEWVALYYTKDAHAGNCLTPNFVFKDNDNSIARRHQGISMFGEDKAFNLNSHVYSANAKGAYLTVRYSTTKKAAADMPAVIGSMFATGALYAVTALAGAGLGVGGTILFQNIKKKKREKTKQENTEANA